ncbi:alkaline phosphatase [Thalassoglobus sp.]|uniref:alkaline phosphatase n=1 Tax=Thalassoglobus sp. TaxID=2795869 RepID=UPI003AA98CA8
MPRIFLLLTFASLLIPQANADHIFELQTNAIKDGKAEFGHWGWEKDKYMLWGTHSNRLIPVYTFGTLNSGEGINLQSYVGKNSIYRSEKKLTDLYGQVPEGTVNPKAEYMDQTDVFRIQKAALKAGKKNIILVVFDGMDWQTTQSASIIKLNKIAYESGRGTGFHFQDYKADGTTQFTTMVTAPYVDNVKIDVDEQTISEDPNSFRGGYAYEFAGAQAWDTPAEPEYLMGRKTKTAPRQPYTDSASSAVSMTAGIKTYNAAINIDHNGKMVDTIAHLAQKEGYKVGVVTSVPISHATPASAYSHNVKRHDYQDLTNDLLGVKSVNHPQQPLQGVDVLIGAGYGEVRSKDSGQGKNFVEGNAYLTAQTLNEIDFRNGGKYVVAIRQQGVDGAEQLKEKAEEAIARDSRLFGFFGVKGGHLPYQTADGDFQPAIGRKKTAEKYSKADLRENPNLSEMTEAALSVLEKNEKGFWLMVEAGDVDWANHDNNIDNSAGAVMSGDAAVKVVTDWVEKNSSWDETVMIVTADHGHFLVLEKPELLVSPAE